MLGVVALYVPSKKHQLNMSKLYLLGYNSVQAAGWSYMLIKMGAHFAAGGEVGTLYDGVKTCLQVFQTLAMLELVHAFLGLVRSSVQVTLQQLFARLRLLQFT